MHDIRNAFLIFHMTTMSNILFITYNMMSQYITPINFVSNIVLHNKNIDI